MIIAPFSTTLMIQKSRFLNGQYSSFGGGCSPHALPALITNTLIASLICQAQRCYPMSASLPPSHMGSSTGTTYVGLNIPYIVGWVPLASHYNNRVTMSRSYTELPGATRSGQERAPEPTRSYPVLERVLELEWAVAGLELELELELQLQLG